MKLPLFTLITLQGISTAYCYTLTVTNQSSFGDPDLPIVDNSGQPLSTGVVAAGFFNSDADVVNNAGDFASLVGAFTEYGTASSFASASVTDGLTDLVTPANWTVVVPLGSTQAQIGQNIYVIIGNGATLGTSDELAVWRSDAIFGTDDAAGNGGEAVSLATGSGALLLGNDTGATVIGGVVNFSNNITLTSAVPEPSTGLLALFAGLGLVGRRRR